MFSHLYLLDYIYYLFHEFSHILSHFSLNFSSLFKVKGYYNFYFYKLSTTVVSRLENKGKLSAQPDHTNVSAITLKSGKNVVIPMSIVILDPYKKATQAKVKSLKQMTYQTHLK